MNLKIFKNRTAGFYVGLAAAVLSLITAAFYAIYALSVQLFVPTIFVMLLLGGISFLGVLFFDFKPLTLIPVIFYAIALALHISDRVEMFAYMATGVYGMGEQGAVLEIVLALLVLSALSLIGGIASNFMKQRKDA